MTDTTPDERTALVDLLRHAQMTPPDRRQIVDLLESDGKRLALAEKTISEVRAWKRARQTGASGSYANLARVLATYDAATEAL